MKGMRGKFQKDDILWKRMQVWRKHQRMQQDLTGHHSTISTKVKRKESGEPDKKEDSPLDGVFWGRVFVAVSPLEKTADECSSLLCAQAMSHGHPKIATASVSQLTGRWRSFRMHTANAATANGEAVSLSAWRIAPLQSMHHGHKNRITGRESTMPSRPVL